MTRFAFPLIAAALAVSNSAAAVAAAAPDGLVRHYVRSNRDGSEAENIVHFRPSRTDVAVYKYMDKCTTAAFVTAQLDPARMEPLGLDAGKVARDGSQAKFGRIDADLATRKVSVWADFPGGRMSDDAIMPAGMNWFLYDYDLGDLNAWLQDKKPVQDFTFAWALIWPEDKDFFIHMASIHAAHRGIEVRDGKPTRRFNLHFIAARNGSGTLWLDPESGAIIEAETSVPNHPGMKDFRLKLQRAEPGGQAACDALLKGHYADCKSPAERG